MIITANAFFSTSWEAYRLMAIGLGMAKKGLKDGGLTSSDTPIKAHVNHGRWSVKCECGGSEYAWEERHFMCQSCWNARHRHQYRRAEFPPKRLEIEALLEARPLPNRNWYPHETPADLRRENREHSKELLEVSR